MKELWIDALIEGLVGLAAWLMLLVVIPATMYGIGHVVKQGVRDHMRRRRRIARREAWEREVQNVG